MGYANSLPYQQLDVFTSLRDVVSLTNAAADYDVANFVFPDFTLPLSHAFIDLIVMSAEETSANNNGISSGSFGIVDTGATYRASNTLSGNTFSTKASVQWHGQYIYPGVNNLSAYVTSGATQMFKFYQTRAVFTTLDLKGLCGRARLYFIS